MLDSPDPEISHFHLDGLPVLADVVVGGIIPPDDADVLRGKGVAAVYTPKDFELDRIVADMVGLVERRRGVGSREPGALR